MYEHDGKDYFFGNNAAPLRFGWPVFGDTPQALLIPRSEWEPASLANYRSGIKDQGRTQSCNGFATCYAMEATRRMEGLPGILLSPGYLYGSINGGRDGGSTLEDGLAQATTGIAPASLVPELAWQKSAWPLNAAYEGAAYRVTEVYLAPTFEHMASAILAGFQVITGISWFANFMRPDAQGWLPAHGLQMVGGHALARDGLAFRNGVWGLDGPNSWGKTWGKEGACVIPETVFLAEHTIGGTWAIRATVQEAGDLPALKPLS